MILNLDNHGSENCDTWTKGTLEDPMISDKGPMPLLWAKGQNLVQLCKIDLIIHEKTWAYLPKMFLYP